MTLSDPAAVIIGIIVACVWNLLSAKDKCDKAKPRKKFYFKKYWNLNWDNWVKNLIGGLVFGFILKSWSVSLLASILSQNISDLAGPFLSGMFGAFLMEFIFNKAKIEE